MAESSKKVVVVLGATGAQGGPVVRYILKNSSDQFRVRAVTRNPSKPAAQELASLGAEVVAADFDNEDTVRSALIGASAIFAITNFWDQNSLETEVKQGKLINKLASQVPELEHYVFSALPDGRKLAGGKYQNILPYNAKAFIREDLKDEFPKLWAKTTEVYVSFYFKNWLKYGTVFAPQKDANGTWVLSMPYPPSTKVPASSSDDSGAVVDAILRGGKEYYGRTVTLVGEIVPEEEKLRAWAEELKINAVFEEVTREQYKKRMEAAGLPVSLAEAVSQLCEALPLEEAVMESVSMVKGREIIPASYKLKSWVEYIKEEDWSSIL